MNIATSLNVKPLPTLRKTWNDYKITRTLRESSIKTYWYHLGAYVADWLDKPIQNIDKNKILAKHKMISEKSGHAVADTTMRIVGSLLGFAAVVYDIKELEPNPIRILSKVQAWNKKQIKTRMLSISQLPAFFRGLSELRSRTLRDVHIFILLTGMRKTCAANLAWKDVDFAERTITVSAENTKNGNQFVLPLSNQLVTFLEQRKGLDPLYIFGGRRRGTPFNSSCGYQFAVALTGLEWSPHDLRRTFINIALDHLKIEHDIVQRLANHTMTFDITSRYGCNVVERLRTPMQLISDFILDKGSLSITESPPPQQETVSIGSETKPFSIPTLTDLLVALYKTGNQCELQSHARIAARLASRNSLISSAAFKDLIETTQ